MGESCKMLEHPTTREGSGETSHTGDRNRANIPQLGRTAVEVCRWANNHLIQNGFQRTGIVITGDRQVVKSMSQGTLQSFGAIRTPDSITSIIVTTRSPSHVADPQGNLRRTICSNHGLVNTRIIEAEPETGFRHGLLAFSPRIGIVGVIKRNITND